MVKFVMEKSFTRLLALALLVLAAAIVPGCGVAQMAAYAVAGNDRPVDVKAEYAGLQNKTVAVLVGIDPDTALRYKNAQSDLSLAVSRQIAKHVEGARMVDPGQTAKFAEANPYWSAQPAGDILNALHAERLVVVDVGRYSDHDTGNTYEWRGLIQANLSVYAADAVRADDRVYATSMEIHFPDTKTVGPLDTDPRVIQQGLREVFAQKAAFKFYDHEEVLK